MAQMGVRLGNVFGAVSLVGWASESVQKSVQSGDQIIFYTDGITEAHGRPADDDRTLIVVRLL
jgi:serine phosphatase RsbU (regulator of sigma subunit)